MQPCDWRKMGSTSPVTDPDFCGRGCKSRPQWQRCVATTHCIVVSLNMKAIQNYNTWHHQRKYFIHYVSGKGQPVAGKIFSGGRQLTMADMLQPMNISSIVISCINIMVISIHVCCSSAQSVVAPTINHTTHGRQSTPLLPHTTQLEDLN